MEIKAILALSAGLCTVGGVSAGCYYSFNTNKTKEIEIKDTQESISNPSPTNLETSDNQGTPKTEITQVDSTGRAETESPTDGRTVSEARTPNTLSSSDPAPEQVPAAPQAPLTSGLPTDRAQST